MHPPCRSFSNLILEKKKQYENKETSRDQILYFGCMDITSRNLPNEKLGGTTKNCGENCLRTV